MVEILVKLEMILGDKRILCLNTVFRWLGIFVEAAVCFRVFTCATHVHFFAIDRPNTPSCRHETTNSAWTFGNINMSRDHM